MIAVYRNTFCPDTVRQVSSKIIKIYTSEYAVDLLLCVCWNQLSAPNLSSKIDFFQVAVKRIHRGSGEPKRRHLGSPLVLLKPDRRFDLTVKKLVDSDNRDSVN